MSGSKARNPRSSKSECKSLCEKEISWIPKCRRRSLKKKGVYHEGESDVVFGTSQIRLMWREMSRICSRIKSLGPLLDVPFPSSTQDRSSSSSSHDATQYPCPALRHMDRSLASAMPLESKFMVVKVPHSPPRLTALSGGGTSFDERGNISLWPFACEMVRMGLDRGTARLEIFLIRLCRLLHHRTLS